jgi:hypothetical protein
MDFALPDQRQITCPKNHILLETNDLASLHDKEGDYKVNHYVCNACGKDLECTTTASQHCSSCYFDLCPSCFQAQRTINLTCKNDHDLFKVTNLNTFYGSKGYRNNSYLCNFCHDSFDAQATPSTHCSCCKFDLCPDCITVISNEDIWEREKILQEHIKKFTKKYGSWGPHAPPFPRVKVPTGEDRVQWMRNRIIEVTKRYIGFHYQHHHIPLWVSEKNEQGIDCSNFTSWVYNFGLGIKFTSDCKMQSESDKAGRKLQPEEKLEPGDLLFIQNRDKSCISHVVIYMGDGKIVDSGKGGVQERCYGGWYKSHHIFTRRLIE